VSRRRDIDVILLPESADARVDFVLEEAVICVPTVEVDVCRDAKGNYLIALAEEAAAAFSRHRRRGSARAEAVV
jgi:predicted nucleic acid-binding protein